MIQSISVILCIFGPQMAYHKWSAVCAPIIDTYLVSPHGQGCGTSNVHVWSEYTTCVCICTEVLRCPAVGHVLAWWSHCCNSVCLYMIQSISVQSVCFRVCFGVVLCMCAYSIFRPIFAVSVEFTMSAICSIFGPQMAYHIWTAVCAPIIDTYLVSPHGQGCGTSNVHVWSEYTTCVCICTEVLRCPAVGHVLAWWSHCCNVHVLYIIRSMCVILCICTKCMYHPLYINQSIFGQCADSSCHTHHVQGGACIEQGFAGITKIILGAESVYVHLRTFCVISRCHR